MIFLPSKSSKAQVPELLNQVAFRNDVLQALDSLYDLRFDASKRVLAQHKSLYPTHPMWEFWDGLILWWRILPNLEDHSLDNEFYFRFKKSDYAANQILREQNGHVDALMIKTIANGFIARQLANRDEWIKSLQTARVGIESLLELEKVRPDLIDIQFGFGLYDFYMAFLPTEFPILEKLSWVLPEGDRKGGLKKLETVADSGLFLRAESRYFLANIYQNYELNEQKSLQHFEILAESFPSNPFYAKRLIQLYYTNFPYEEAIVKMDSVLNLARYKNGLFYFTLQEEAHLYMGRANLTLGKEKQAYSHFLEAFSIADSQPNKLKRTRYAASCYFLGQTTFRLKQNDEAKKWFTRAAKTKTSYSDSAKNRLSEIQKLK